MQQVVTSMTNDTTLRLEAPERKNRPGFIDATPAWSGLLNMARNASADMRGWGIVLWLRALPDDWQARHSYTAGKAYAHLYGTDPARRATTEGEAVLLPVFDATPDEEAQARLWFRLEDLRLGLVEAQRNADWLGEVASEEDADQFSQDLANLMNRLTRMAMQHAQEQG